MGKSSCGPATPSSLADWLSQDQCIIESFKGPILKAVYQLKKKPKTILMHFFCNMPLKGRISLFFFNFIHISWSLRV